MDDQQFDEIQRKIRDALPDIASAYESAGREPHGETIDAFAELFDCSPNELRKLISNLQNSN